MKMPLSQSIWSTAPGAPESTNCGRNAKKNSVSFGLSTFTATAVPTNRSALGVCTGPASGTSSDLSRHDSQAR